jgi:N-succinyldiaminopimelate aminotransferase
MMGRDLTSRRAAVALSSGGVAQTWTEITALARRPGVLSLGQGAPDMGGSHPAAAAAAIAAIDGNTHDQYSPVPGVPALREAIVRYEARVFGGRQPDPDKEIAVSTSATEALLAAFYALTDPGDEVICVEPLFPWYPSQLKLAGAVPVPVRMAAPSADGQSFAFPLDGLRQAITPRTRAIIHNTPHNPTGAVATREETEAIARLCIEHDLVCIADDVYHRHTFDGKPHVRICDMEGMADRTLTINSAGKLLNCTGWRVGWVSGPERLVAATNLYRGFMTYCAPAPFQVAVAAALDALPASEDTNRDIMQANYHELSAALRTRGLRVYGTDGGYFLVADCAPLGMSSLDYCRQLVDDCGVVCVPLSCFYAPAPRVFEPLPTAEVQPADSDGLLRFALCKSREYIGRCCKRLTGVDKQA